MREEKALDWRFHRRSSLLSRIRRNIASIAIRRAKVKDENKEWPMLSRRQSRCILVADC